jgi:hypothetical protein
MPKYIPSLGVSKFTELDDAPKSYSGQGGKIVQVKLDESGLEFSDSLLKILFGDGSDGDVTISSDTTLTRDMFYNNLTVNSGVKLRTNGYRIFVKETLTNNGIIHNNGGDASGATGGAGAPAGTLPGGANGANGIVYSSAYSGGGGGGGGVVFIAAKKIINNGEIRANGGKGGNGYSAYTGVYRSSGASGNSVSLGEGGNGGSGGGTWDPSYGTTSGGGGGIVTHPVNKTYRVPILGLKDLEKIGGGAGGGSGALTTSSSWSAGGGGGGGGGGFIIIYYRTATWNIEEAGFGSFGLGSAIGSASADNGTNGAPGIVIKIQV